MEANTLDTLADSLTGNELEVLRRLTQLAINQQQLTRDIEALTVSIKAQTYGSKPAQ